MSITFASLLLLQDVSEPAHAPSPGAQPAAEAVAAISAAPAADAPAPAVSATATPVALAAPAPTRPRTTLSDAQIQWVNRRWSGFGVGYDNGLWGGKYGQSLKVVIPFGRNVGRYFGMRVRGALVHHVDSATDHYDPVVNVGGELFGRSPVWWGVLRVYGGGGVWAGIRPEPTRTGSRYGVGGGGFFGFEAFAAQFMSFTFEVGGQAPGHSLGVDAGGSAMGGLMFYFGRTDTRWSATR